jgi:ectoine hydroxylase-related dioxygenase (phytanoyl-CoA dioxygenase family)
MKIASEFPTDEQLVHFENDGFVVVRALFSPEEAALLRDHFMDIHRQALSPNSPLRKHYQPQTQEKAGTDVLRHYPRILQPHRFDESSMSVMLDKRIEAALWNFFGEEPLAAQSMMYFKPPEARGQALHQDDFFIKVKPGTCIAAWLALEEADSNNGTLLMVPGSHVAGVLCPHAADLTQSFTTEEVDIPADMEVVSVDFKPGDVMFFNGGVIHGSYPNNSKDRFRRSLICHYVANSCREMNAGLYPLHSFAGEKIERGRAAGGPCGSEDWETFRAGVEAQLHEDKFGETSGEYVRIGEYFMFGPQGAVGAKELDLPHSKDRPHTLWQAGRRFGGRVLNRITKSISR